MLIDVPYPGNYESFRECLEEAGIAVSDVKYLLLTHHHDDHLGCVNELVRDTGATIIVHEKAVTHLAAGRSDPDDRPINQCIGFRVEIYSRPIYVQDSEQTFRSWERLKEHGAQVIYPSHGDPFAAEELVAVGLGRIHESSLTDDENPGGSFLLGLRRQEQILQEECGELSAAR